MKFLLPSNASLYVTPEGRLCTTVSLMRGMAPRVYEVVYMNHLWEWVGVEVN